MAMLVEAPAAVEDALASLLDHQDGVLQVTPRSTEDWHAVRLRAEQRMTLMEHIQRQPLHLKFPGKAVKHKVLSCSIIRSAPAVENMISLCSAGVRIAACRTIADCGYCSARASSSECPQ